MSSQQPEPNPRSIAAAWLRVETTLPPTVGPSMRTALRGMFFSGFICAMEMLDKAIDVLSDQEGNALLSALEAEGRAYCTELAAVAVPGNPGGTLQ